MKALTAVGNILYIPTTITLMPQDFTTPSPYGSSLPIDSHYVLRAIDFSNPKNPLAEQSIEGEINLFGIPSLDVLNRKYGVYKIEYPNTKNLSYYVPYYASPPALSTEDYDYSIEDIKKDRDLRTFYLTFPGSVGLDEIVADYQENPYVITAEISTLEIYEYPVPYGVPYYSILGSGPGIYGGIYGTSLYGSYPSISQPSVYPSYYGVGMPAGLATSYIDSGENSLNTVVNTRTSWLGTQNTTSSPLWNNWPLSSSAQRPANSWIW
ncbi:MAG: hypothetical protein ACMUJM_24210 [bacterium]